MDKLLSEGCDVRSLVSNYIMRWSDEASDVRAEFTIHTASSVRFIRVCKRLHLKPQSKKKDDDISVYVICANSIKLRSLLLVIRDTLISVNELNPGVRKKRRQFPGKRRV